MSNSTTKQVNVISDKLTNSMKLEGTSKTPTKFTITDVHSRVNDVLESARELGVDVTENMVNIGRKMAARRRGPNYGSEVILP